MQYSYHHDIYPIYNISSLSSLSFSLFFHSLSGFLIYFFFSSRRRHTRCSRDWSSDVCSSDLFDPPQSSACSHWLAGMPLPSARQARETLRSWSARPSDFLVLRAERFRQMTAVSLWAPRLFLSRSPQPTAEEPAVPVRAGATSLFSQPSISAAGAP